MQEAVIDDEAVLAKIMGAGAKGGHSYVAALSSAGLSGGRVRITILPLSALKPGASQPSAEEMMAAFREVQEASRK